jgi:hypothetical protein
VAAKCNIASLVLEKVNAGKWGFDCKESQLGILQNYIQYLACDTVSVGECAPQDCKWEATIFNCNFNILKTSLSVSEDNLTFSFQLGDIVGGRQPFTYLWLYDTEDFTVQGPTTQATLLLKLKPGKDLDLLVSRITMKITDADNCYDEKIVWLVNGELINWNYTACPNPNQLVIANKITYCPPASGLIVTKKV